MLQVVWTRQAREDLLAIWDYVARDSIEAADRVAHLLDEKCALLAKSPLIGTPCPALAQEMRFVTAHNYVVFYRTDARDVTVVRVVHGARDIGALFGPD